MKKKILHLGVLSMLSISLLTNCQNNDKSVLEVQEEEPKTEIEALEKEYGLTYFKKDLTLKDEKGLNEIKIRLGSQNKLALENYLSNHKISLVVKDREEKLLESSNQSDTKKNVNQVEPAESEKVIIEILSQKQENPNKLIGLNINISENYAKSLNKGGRVQAYLEYAELSSPEYPKYVNIHMRPEIVPGSLLGYEYNKTIEVAFDIRRTGLTAYQQAAWQQDANAAYPYFNYVIANTQNANQYPVFIWKTIQENGQFIFNLGGRRAKMKVNFTSFLSFNPSGPPSVTHGFDVFWAN